MAVGDKAPAVAEGQVLVRVDPQFSAPRRWNTPETKAEEKLTPEITTQEMCAEMVADDLATAQRHAFLKANGFELPVAVES